MKMKNYLMAGAAATVLVFNSCSKKVDTGVDKEGLKPNEVVETWMKDARAGRVVSLWDSLPSSYQNDVQGLAREFGGKVDSEMYGELMKTLDEASDLLKNKKGLIFEIMEENKEMVGGENADAVKENYDAIVDLVDVIVNSQIKDTDGLKKVEMMEFLAEIEPKFKSVATVFEKVGMGTDDFERFKNLKVEVVSESGDEAVVKMVDAKDGEDPMTLKKVGKRWVPADMVKDWDKTMEEAREGLAEMEKMSDVDKQQALGVMRTVQAVLKDLDTAKTKEELMQKIEEAGNKFGGMF